MRASAVEPGTHTPRVLLLGLRASSFTDTVWPALDPWFQVYGACPEQGDWADLPYHVREVGPDVVSVRQAPQVSASWVKSRVQAHQLGAPPTWLWGLKRNRWLREALRRADVVVALDVQTDRALRAVPGLLSGSTVIASTEAGLVANGLRLLESVIAGLEVIVSERRRPWGIRRRPLDEASMEALVSSVDPLAAASVPVSLLPVGQLAELGRLLSASMSRVQSATILLDVLGPFRWAEADEVGASGLAAQQASAGLWLAETESDLPDTDVLYAPVRSALVGADLALAGGNTILARRRLADAMSLMFHRERHAESGSSPLVTETDRFLGPLYANRTFQHLTRDAEPRRLRRRPQEGDDTRVLVLTSASGQFHRPVVAALSGVATVTVRGAEMSPRFLPKRGTDVGSLEALAMLHDPEAGTDATDSYGAKRSRDSVVRGLAPRLRETDVVWADWADQITVWASHMVPAGVRFVLRVHSLDTFQPWFHLIKWSNVDHVTVPAEPLRRFVVQMLRVAGADVPVSIVPNVVTMGDFDHPKERGARTTLGMIGWGRRVKDPLWALDLLAREPSWRLVLIGHELHTPASRSAASYNDEVRARLTDPEIAERVELVGWTSDISHHLRRIGVILSTSRRESWHLGLVEGAASGAVPVVRDWPMWQSVGGARSLFPDDWVVDDLDQAEARVRATTDPAVWDAVRHRAQEQARELFDPDLAAEQYRELILGPRVRR